MNRVGILLTVLLFSVNSYALVCPDGVCPPVGFFQVPQSSSSRAGNFSADPTYQAIFKSVDQSNLIQILRHAAGVDPVQVGSEKFSITNRYSPADKNNFRKFWIQYFKTLNIPVNEIAYPTQHSNGENEGHNVEAVLAGKSADSVVIIVHYDSIGVAGQETANPGVDDDMTGMSTLMETARILSQHRQGLQHTVRFVAADYEEWSGPGLEGARAYAKYIQAKSQKEGFKIIAAIDDEQSGWNCLADGSCTTEGTYFNVYSCDGGNYNSASLGDQLEQTASQYSSLKVKRDCMGENSDHYAMWEIGVPSVVFSEYDPFSNPHFDQNGGDTFDKIDQNYFFHIAQVGVTFAAQLVGLE